MAGVGGDGGVQRGDKRSRAGGRDGGLLKGSGLWSEWEGVNGWGH